MAWQVNFDLAVNQARRSGELLSNFYNTAYTNYNNSVDLHNNTLENRATASAEREIANAARSERFRIVNAQAAADFNAIGTDFIDFDSDAVRFNIAAGISQRDVQELTNIALGIVAAPLLFTPGVGSLAVRGLQLLGRETLVSGVIGAGANLAESYVTDNEDNFTLREGLQSAFIGFVGGAVTGGTAKFGLNPFAASGLGSFVGELTTQYFNGEFDRSKLASSALFGIGRVVNSSIDKVSELAFASLSNSITAVLGTFTNSLSTVFDDISLLNVVGDFSNGIGNRAASRLNQNQQLVEQRKNLETRFNTGSYEERAFLNRVGIRGER